jgi:hypothetical protein
MTNKPEKPGPGRPEHKPTAALKRQVQLRTACGWTKEKIAIEIGISVPTLDKHYMVDLETGWTRKRGEVLDMLFQAAKKGNVSAMNRMLDRIDRANPDYAPPESAENSEHDESNAEASRGYVSKKETANQQAKSAGSGTEWEGLLTPGSATKN